MSALDLWVYDGSRLVILLKIRPISPGHDDDLPFRVELWDDRDQHVEEFDRSRFRLRASSAARSCKATGLAVL